MQGITIQVRPIVAEFALEMERRLAQRDSSGEPHWLDAPAETLAKSCVSNITKATKPAFVPGDIIAQRSAIDAANYAMFVWDKHRENPSKDRGAGARNGST